MLSLAKMVTGAEDYYIASVAHGREEYYTGSGESPGFWLGEGARRLELEGPVEPEHLRQVLAGVSPHGEILTAGRVDEAKRVAGFDLTFSAPKSVSLLFGLSDPGVSAIVRGVHEDAVEQALGYLERNALALRRGAGGHNSARAEGLVAAGFTHRTSRAGDPQLHTHVLVANVAKGVDGTWSAPDARLLYHHTRTAGFLYQAALRTGLTRATGVRFGEVSRGMAELDGVPSTLLRAFSTRRREIEHEMARTGVTSARAAEVAALATRPTKDAADAARPTAGLRQRWLARLDELGLAPSHGGSPLEHLLGTEVWRPPTSTEVDQLLDRLAGPEGLTAGQSTFERRDVARLVAEALPRGSRVHDVEVLADRFLKRPDVLAMASIGRGGEILHTTYELLGVERGLLDAAGRMRNGRRAIADGADLASALDHFRLLSDEQAQMVGRLTSSGSGLEVVVGKAGAGKTLALAAARMAWEQSGYRVLGTALSARAARGLREGAGIESQTLASLQADIESGRLQLGANDVIVVDEAGMVGTRALAGLVHSAEHGGAKVVLVGDPRQLPEIEAGGALSGLIERIGAVELTENRRQRSSWERVALDALRMGRPHVALATYERAGRIHAASTMAETQHALVERWAGSFRHGHDAVMLAASRREVAQLNDLARVVLRQSGDLAEDLLAVDDVTFAAGDKVVCLRNDRRLGVVNGTIGTVERRAGNGLVIDTTDGLRALPGAYLEAGHLAHAYALTVHKSQGMTVECAFVLSSESLSRESGYVAMSRATELTELFVPLESSGERESHAWNGPELTDPLVDLTRRFEISRAKQLALFEVGDTTSEPQGGIPPQRALPRGSEVGPDDAADGESYGVRQAARGQGDGKSMGKAELSADPWSTDSVPDIDRRLRESRRRITEQLTRLGQSREIEAPDRSRGRDAPGLSR
jgi:conjugative relaxase-like TrwC/TraI family protein